MSNVLTEDKKQQVIALGRLGWSLRRIQQQTGVRRETAGAYLRAAGVPLRRPRGWGRRPPAKPATEVTTDSVDSGRAKPANGVSTDSGGWADGGANPEPKPAKEVTTDPTVVWPQRSPSASACEPYRDTIELGAIPRPQCHGDLAGLGFRFGFRSSYQSVKRFIRKLETAPVPQARAVITTAPGEEAQVDYGTGPMVPDSLTCKYRRTRLFVLTLGCSRKCVRLLVFRSSTRVWAELHEQAFRRLGGATRIVVLDNLGEGVLQPDLWDPTLNPLYRDVLAHYGAVAMPCRVNDPDRKGKVEAGVGHAKRTPLKGLRFESLEEAQAYLDEWERRWADTRIHGTTKRQVAAMFAEERPHLLPLPFEPFRYYQYGQRTVHLDGCVEVEAAYYSAPLPVGSAGTYGCNGTPSMSVCWNPRNGQLLREHLRQKPGVHCIPREDRPKQTPLTTRPSEHSLYIRLFVTNGGGW